MQTIPARAVFVLAFAAFSLSAALPPPSNRYALILEDAPAARAFDSREGLRSAAAAAYRRQIQARQRTLKAELATRNIPSTGSVIDVLNAVFVTASPDRAAELKSLPGVKAVVPLRRRALKLNRALDLIKAPAAWNAVGGRDNAGRGMRIAILDTGVDAKHPAFQDPALTAPPGFPRCSGGNFDCSQFTNGKVIVARSYVAMIAAGTGSDPTADSRPDDYTPRDREGHGTASASCAAAVTLTTPAGTLSGVAPKAYIGNYKITGSPGINEGSPDDVILQALEDALNDGMDVISFSFGGPALTGPLETGSICGNDQDVPCDAIGVAFENLAQQGVVMVAAGGNEGDIGTAVPSFNTVDSPGNAPSAIGVGATWNAHTFLPGFSVQGGPANLQNLTVRTGDGSLGYGAISGPLRDAAAVGDAYACSALPATSLMGVIALIQRGPVNNACTFATKLENAQNAGALGVVFYNYDPGEISPSGISDALIPVVALSGTNGQAVREYLAANPGAVGTIDPAATEVTGVTSNTIVSFSSLGPTAGGGLKPDLVAPGGDVYMAAQSYDPLGVLYSSTGWSSASGTSFSAPIVSGAAALVKQRHPQFVRLQVKSALVNNASPVVIEDDSGNPADVRATGAGLLDTAAAVNAFVTVEPPTMSFGVVRGGVLPAAQTLTVTNTSANAVTLAAAVESPGPQPSLSRSTLALAAGGTATLTVTPAGAAATAGVYSGVVTLKGTDVSLRVPYMYAVGTGVPASIVPLIDGVAGTAGERSVYGLIALKVVDTLGVPVAGAPVDWTARRGSIAAADDTTDANGVAAAIPILSTAPGTNTFVGEVPGTNLRHEFTGLGRARPSIPGSTSVLNGASFESRIAPGSYISIFGSNLALAAGYANSSAGLPLPLSVNRISVSFDVPSANLSLPGYLTYVSPTQVNVQVPWELQGQFSVRMKVNVSYSPSNVVTLPLAEYAPALFEAGGLAAALDARNRLVTASNAVARGELVQLFANGLGPVTNQPASGDAAPSSPLAQTRTQPVVTIGGQPATVQFSGLAPGYAGLYQVNIYVPRAVSAGNLPVTITMGGVTSKAATLPVR